MVTCHVCSGTNWKFTVTSTFDVKGGLETPPVPSGIQFGARCAMCGKAAIYDNLTQLQHHYLESLNINHASIHHTSEPSRVGT